jgi:hypothetical protein
VLCSPKLCHINLCLIATCSPTKKAYISRQRKYGNPSLANIAKTLDISPSVVSRNYWKPEQQGPDPDFYAKAKKQVDPVLLTPHAERRALWLVTSGAARDATDVQWKLFPDISFPNCSVDVQREGPAWLGTVGKAMAVKTAHHPEFG